jgi:copper chaperone CopZ
MSVTAYGVNGMTCGHCASTVSEKLGQLPGVTGVAVELSTGTATVTSDRPLDAAAVRAAVGEAGYEVADR